MSYEFMGEHVVKNIKELVRIYRIRIEPEADTEKKARFRTWQWAAISVMVILILMAIVYLLFEKINFNWRAADIKQVPAVIEAVRTKKTIAVLPFVNLSSDPEQEYFVDGLSEEILNSLTQVSDLLVIGRTSSFTFKGSNKKTPEIANELGVENILEGSVRKAGNDLRITAQLPDGFHLWSKT